MSLDIRKSLSEANFFWGAIALGGASLLGGMLSSSSSSKAANQASAGAQAGADAQAEATKYAADKSLEATMLSLEAMERATGKSIDELRRQYNITDQQFSMYRQAGTVGLAGYYSMLAASPIQSQREAAQGMLSQMGGTLTSQSQKLIEGGARAPFTSTLGAAPTMPTATAGGVAAGAGGMPSGLTQFQQNQWLDAQKGNNPWNAQAYASVQNNNAFGVAGGDNSAAIAQYETDLAEWERKKKADDQARADWESTPQYETVTDEYNIPEVTPIEFETSPGYEWRLAQGQKAIENAAAARGQQLSPQTQMALSEYAQGQASQEYNTFLNQYYQSLTPFQTLYSGGQAAAAGTANVGSNTASDIANLYQQLGANQANTYTASGAQQGNIAMAGANAQAAGLRSVSGYQAQNTVNQGNIWGGALQQGAMAYGASQNPYALQNWGYM